MKEAAYKNMIKVTHFTARQLDGTTKEKNVFQSINLRIS